MNPSNKSHTRSASTNVILVKMTRPLPRMRSLKRNLKARRQYLPLAMTKHLPMDTTGLISPNIHHFPETVGKLIPRHISQVGLLGMANRRCREPRPQLNQRTCHLRLKNPRLIRNQPVNHPSKTRTCRPTPAPNAPELSNPQSSWSPDIWVGAGVSAEVQTAGSGVSLELAGAAAFGVEIERSGAW